MIDTFQEENSDSAGSQQKKNEKSERAMKRRLSKYNFKEVDSVQSRKSGSHKAGSHSLAALQLFKNNK